MQNPSALSEAVDKQESALSAFLTREFTAEDAENERVTFMAKHGSKTEGAEKPALVHLVGTKSAAESFTLARLTCMAKPPLIVCERVLQETEPLHAEQIKTAIASNLRKMLFADVQRITAQNILPKALVAKPSLQNPPSLSPYGGERERSKGEFCDSGIFQL